MQRASGERNARQHERASCPGDRSDRLAKRQRSAYDADGRRSEADRFGLLARSGRVRSLGLRLLEEKLVELNIVAKASDNRIGRTLKKPR